MARIRPPDGGLTFLDHQPEIFAAFNRLYGTLWSEGAVDQATKEVGRLRNANVTGCNICRNLRFAGARAAGLTEEMVSHITDPPDEAPLGERHRLVIRWTDAIIGHPGSIDADLARAVRDEFPGEQLDELTLTVALAMGFSKAAVAWGPPPDMPVLEVPTPTPDGTVA